VYENIGGFRGTINAGPLLTVIGFDFCASCISSGSGINQLIVENKIGELSQLLPP
jgi:hypothetical protein